MANPATGPHLRSGAWASLALAAGLVAAVIAAILTIGP
jgi:hypothetical protein